MSGFERAMYLMRRHDPQRREDGFAMLRVHAAEHVDELVAEFHSESDHGPAVLAAGTHRLRPVCARPTPFVQQLHGQDDDLRGWAVRGLQLLDTREARQALHRARQR